MDMDFLLVTTHNNRLYNIIDYLTKNSAQSCGRSLICPVVLAKDVARNSDKMILMGAHIIRVHQYAKFLPGYYTVLSTSAISTGIP